MMSEAWVSKITSSTPIRPNHSDSLQDFADNVCGCLETLKAMGKLDEVSSWSRLVKLMNYSPLYLVSGVAKL